MLHKRLYVRLFELNYHSINYLDDNAEILRLLPEMMDSMGKKERKKYMDSVLYSPNRFRKRYMHATKYPTCDNPHFSYQELAKKGYSYESALCKLDAPLDDFINAMSEQRLGYFKIALNDERFNVITHSQRKKILISSQQRQVSAELYIRVLPLTCNKRRYRAHLEILID